MALEVLHATRVVNKPNRSEKSVSRDAWNEEHLIRGASNTYLGFDSEGDGVEKTVAELKAELSFNKNDIGLGNVDNTADIDKPVSTATQISLDTKVDTADLADDTGSSLVGFVDSGAGAVGITLQALLRGSWTFAAAYGASSSASASVNTAAINAAISAIGALGGGTVLLPRGTITLTNENPGAANWNNNRAIYVGQDNIHLLGFGRGATILTLENGADCHVVQFGQRVTTIETVHNCSLKNVEINGNRSNQSAPTDADDHWHGVDVADNCTRISIEDFYIHDCQYYGIGMQRQGISYCKIANGVVENTGSDSIDWKNDDGSGTGNIIRDVTAINPGLATGLSLPLAAFDLRSGIYFSNITAFDLGAEPDLVGLRINVDANSTEAAIPVYPTSGTGVTVIGTNGATSVGVRIAVRNTRISNVMVRAFNQGIRISSPDVKISQFDVHANAQGIVLTAGTTVEADTCEFTNGTVRDNTTAGFVYDSVDEITVANVDVRGNGIGHDIRTGSTNITIFGGSCSGNTTNVSNSGSSIIIRHVKGFRTAARPSTTFAIGSTGIKTVVIPHGLAVTPNKNEVIPVVEESSAVDDAIWSSVKVVSTDATNVTCKVNVTTASATGGATAILRLHINSLVS